MTLSVVIGIAVAGLLLALPYYRQHRAVEYIESVGGHIPTHGGGPISLFPLRRAVAGSVQRVFGPIGEVTLSDSRVTDAGLVQLDDLPDLEKLWLNGTWITDAGLVHLSGQTKLKWLFLDGTGISDAGLVHLGRMTNLEWLWLSGTGVTDAGLVPLCGLKKLTTLSLQRTRVSDAGLIHLGGLTKLETLWLGETQVSERGVEALRKKLPDCNIILQVDEPKVATPGS